MKRDDAKANVVRSRIESHDRFQGATAFALLVTGSLGRRLSSKDLKEGSLFSFLSFFCISFFLSFFRILFLDPH